jgi:predicted transposase YbfD/YdcC
MGLRCRAFSATILALKFTNFQAGNVMSEVAANQFESLKNTCRQLDDPRTPINIFHPVENIVAISIAAIIAGAEGPKSIARWAKNKKQWLATWLDLPKGQTPSRDCIRTFFGRVEPAAFQACFFDWLDRFTQDRQQTGDLPVVAIDGKALRHSFDTSKGWRPLHLVSAWVAEHHISLGQIATEEKSNEITAIPELLERIDVEDAIVTIDAMGCQKEITAKITKRKGKFVIAVKGNQPTLHKTIESFFHRHWKNDDWCVGRCNRHHTSEKHGSRQEDRYYYVAPIPRREKVFANWPSVKAIGMVISVRQKGEEVTEEVRYYILSDYLKGKDFARAVRQHWSIENNCHWQLDVLFCEDASRVRERTLTNNISWMRRVAISLLKHHPSKDSLKGKRQSAGWNARFLAEVLQIKQ